MVVVKKVDRKIILNKIILFKKKQVFNNALKSLILMFEQFSNPRIFEIYVKKFSTIIFSIY